MYSIMIYLNYYYHSSSFTEILMIMSASTFISYLPLFNRVKVMVLVATFNNVSVISWQSVLLVE